MFRQVPTLDSEGFEGQICSGNEAMKKFFKKLDEVGWWVMVVLAFLLLQISNAIYRALE